MYSLETPSGCLQIKVRTEYKIVADQAVKVRSRGSNPRLIRLPGGHMVV